VLIVFVVGYLVVGASLAGLTAPFVQKGVPGWAESGSEDPVTRQMYRDVNRRFEWFRFELDVRDKRTVLRFGLLLLVLTVAWPMFLLLSWRVQRRYNRR
jgi:hypothetical protein